MRLDVPEHHFSIETSDDWVVDEAESAEQRATLGIYLRSVAFGLYVNVRQQSVGDHPKTGDGLLAFLREQGWASASFDEWTEIAGCTIAVGGTFEMTPDRSGEVVHEAFVTDGRIVVNLATPGPRAVIEAAIPSVKKLVSAITFR